MTARPTPTPVYSDQERRAFWLAAITSKPPRVRFSSEIRESLTDKEESLNLVASDGSFEVLNARTNFTQKYAARAH